MLLLDTSFLIEFEDELVNRKSGPARAVLTAHRRQAAGISIITLGEFAEGFTDPRALLEFLAPFRVLRSEEHTSELQSPCNLVCRLLLEKKNSTLSDSDLAYDEAVSRGLRCLAAAGSSPNPSCLPPVPPRPRPSQHPIQVGPSYPPQLLV